MLICFLFFRFCLFDHFREKVIDDFGKVWIALYVGRVVMLYFSIRIDNVNSMELHTDCSVRDSIGISVAKSTIEGVVILWEEISDLLECCNLE